MSGPPLNIALSFPGCHRRGGIERVMIACANHLAGCGHRVSVVSDKFDDPGLDPSVRQVPTGNPSSGGALQLVRFSRASRRVMAELRPDVHGAFSTACPPGGVLWMQAVHRHWIDVARRTRGLVGRLRQRLNPLHPVACTFERNYIAGRRYAKLIALSEGEKRAIIALYGVSPQDVHVLPNGFADDEFTVADTLVRAERRRAYGLCDGQKVVAFVANEAERKGFRPLLEAVTRLERPDVAVLVAGRLAAARYRPLVSRLGLEGRVKFVGPTPDVAGVYAAADLFVLPTVYEAWGLVIVEALACGLPVVVSRCAGAASAVHEGRTGELLDNPADVTEIVRKIKLVLDRPRQDPGAIAGSVRAFAWRNVLPRYEQLLVEAAGRPGSDARRELQLA